MENEQKTTVVVSGNYFDRKSKTPWLIRVNGESIENAQKWKTIQASGVTFVRSTKEEQGFGCKIIAECEMALGTLSKVAAIPKGAVELRFRVFGFYRQDNEESVKRCKTLTLCSDGRMFAEI